MRRATVAFCSALLVACGAALAETGTYRPLRTWIDPQLEAFGRWDAGRQDRSTRAAEPRPQLPGLRARGAELLQDGLRRKFPHKAKTDRDARQWAVSNSKSKGGVNVLNGAMAEALFADRNQEFRYVAAPNAPQHDFTRPLPRGGRQNVQVKFFTGGDPARYARAMRDDWRATKFAVPDDHLAGVREYLSNGYRRSITAGDAENARVLGRDLGRLRGIGATSEEIVAVRRKAVASFVTESRAAYTSLGASLVLAMAPEVWSWAEGGAPSNQALYRAGRASSLLGVGIGTDQFLRHFKDGSLRGTVRGNAIVGTAFAITEVTYLTYEHGWSRAFRQPEFYEEVGGSVGGIAFGIAGSAAAVAWVPGPGWVVGGTAVVAGVTVGTVGYVGGRAGTQMILEIVAPGMMREQQQRQVASVRAALELRTLEAQVWP